MSLLLVSRRRPQSLYDSVSERCAAVVIRRYSSSFGLACRLLAEPVRTQVRNVYALVRVADEIVDNPDPGLGPEARAQMLTWLHDDVRHALRHRLQRQPRRARLRPDGDRLRDRRRARRPVLRLDAHGPRDHASTPARASSATSTAPRRWSGLMCLRVFLADGAPTGRGLRPARARRAAARRRLPEAQLPARPRRGPRHAGPLLLPRASTSSAFCDADRDRILDDIAADLAAAAAVVPDLPGQQPPGRPGRARDVHRARRPAARHPGRGDPAHPRPRARPGQDPAARRCAVRRTVMTSLLRPAASRLTAARPAGRSRGAGRRGRGRRRRHRRARHRRAARLARAQRRPAREERRARRSRRQRRARRLPLRHRRLVVPHARGLRALLLPARHHRRRRARPDRPRPELPGLLRGPRRARRHPPRPRAQPGAVRVARAGRRAPGSTPTSSSARGDLRHRAAPLPLQQLRLAARRSCTPTSYAGPRGSAGC